jgi:tetratricopeptide (TPR) repeat protein
MGLIALLLSGMGLPAWAVDGAIRAIRFDPAGRVFRIDASAPVRARMNLLTIAGRKRVIVDVENAEIGRELPRDAQLTQQLSQAFPALRQLTTHQYGNPGHPIVRILLDLDPAIDRAAENVQLRREQGTFLELGVGASMAFRPDTTLRSGVHEPSPGEIPGLRPSHREPASGTAAPNTAMPVYSAGKQAADDSAKLADMQRALLRSNQRYEQLVRDKGQLDQQIRDLSRNAEQARLRLTGDLEALQTENAALKAQAKKAPPGPSPALSQRYEQLAREKGQLDQQIRELRAENEQTRTRLTGQMAALQAENTSLKARKPVSNPSPELNQRYEQLVRDKGQLDQQIRDLRAEAGQAQAQLTHRIETLQAENASLKARKTTASASPATAAAPDKSLSSDELSALRKQVTAAQISLNESIRTINAQNKEIAYLRNQVTEVKTGLDIASRQQVERLQSESADKDTRIRDLERRLSEKTAQAAKAAKPAEQPANTQMAGELAALRRESEALKRQLDDLRHENTTLEERLATAEKTPVTSSTSSPSASDEAEQHYRSGKTAMAARQPEQAVAAYRQAQALDPDNGRYVLDYSAALAEARQYGEGITLLTGYLSRHPADREGYTQLGKLYLLNDQPEAATQAFTRAIPVSTLNNYATALKKTSRLDEAESIFKLALTLNPKDSEVMFNLGNLYNAADKLPLAKDYYLKALHIRPDFAEAHYNLGLIHAKLGERPEAIGHLQEFLKLSPKARNAETIRAYIEKLKA